MSKENNVGRNPTRLEMLASEYQLCITNVHDLIYRFGGNEDVIATLIMMRNFMDASIGSLKRRYDMVFGESCNDSVDYITAVIQKIVEKKQR